MPDGRLGASWQAIYTGLCSKRIFKHYHSFRTFQMRQTLDPLLKFSHDLRRKGQAALGVDLINARQELQIHRYGGKV